MWHSDPPMTSFLSRRVVPLVLIGGAIAGCVPALAMRETNIVIGSAAMAVAPSHVEIYELSTDGLAPRKDWTTSGTKNVDAVLGDLAKANGATVLVPEAVAGTDVPYEQFRRWSQLALLQISDRVEGRGNLKTNSVTEWTLGRSLEPWRGPLHSDFILSVLFMDAHESGGRIAMNVLAGAAGGGGVRVNARQTGIACVVRLRDARIVWCQHKVDPYGDLRQPRTAHQAIDKLLGELLPLGARPAPPPNQDVTHYQ
jgi:hypothetical protein